MRETAHGKPHYTGRKGIVLPITGKNTTENRIRSRKNWALSSCLGYQDPGLPIIFFRPHTFVRPSFFCLHFCLCLHPCEGESLCVDPRDCEIPTDGKNLGKGLCHWHLHRRYHCHRRCPHPCLYHLRPCLDLWSHPKFPCKVRVAKVVLFG